MRFDDYHRTIVGYHGTRLSTALDIVSRRRSFEPSQNADDWLGHGVYFWEYAPHQARSWAERRRKAQGWSEPIAVVGSMIRLGHCLDLLDPHNLTELQGVHAAFIEMQTALGAPIPENYNHRKYLDCAVFEFAYAMMDSIEPKRSVDSARAVYVPTREDKRVWSRSWISKGAHIQVCVRNSACILGTWLHHPVTTKDDHDSQE